MSTDTEKSGKKTRKSSGTPRKPRAKVDMSVAKDLDLSSLTQKLQAMGGTPTWISSAGSMEDASSWHPTEKGAELIGVHAGVDLRGVNQKYYKVAVPDASNAQGYRTETVKASMGNKRLDSIQPGKGVRIVFNGNVDTKADEAGKTRSYRDFLVFQTSL